MRGKLLFIAGGLAGYVLGARAGRQRYEQIKSAANDLWNAQPVQRRVTEVRDLALDTLGDAPVALFNMARKVVSGVASGKRGAKGPAESSVTVTGSSVNGSVPAVVNTATDPSSQPAFGSD